MDATSAQITFITFSAVAGVIVTITCWVIYGSDDIDVQLAFTRILGATISCVSGTTMLTTGIALQYVL
jgi:hypothetical protein